MSAPDTISQNGTPLRLRELARKRALVERCEMCSRELAPEHQHLIEPVQRKLACACDACAVLFTTQAATKFRRVPRRIRYLPDFTMTDAQWNGLMIPIEMAFFFRSSPHERVIAFYPSPAGATESLLALETWDEIGAQNPVLSQMEEDVEALLVNRVGATHGAGAEYYIVPIDKCYELVGTIRLYWHGLSGGTEMWREIKKFFEALKEKADVPSEATSA
jgi:Family of unknown function (DUF5947)